MSSSLGSAEFHSCYSQVATSSGTAVCTITELYTELPHHSLSQRHFVFSNLYSEFQATWKLLTEAHTHDSFTWQFIKWHLQNKCKRRVSWFQFPPVALPTIFKENIWVQSQIYWFANNLDLWGASTCNWILSPLHCGLSWASAMLGRENCSIFNRFRWRPTVSAWS